MKQFTLIISVLMLSFNSFSMNPKEYLIEDKFVAILLCLKNIKMEKPPKYLFKKIKVEVLKPTIPSIIGIDEKSANMIFYKIIDTKNILNLDNILSLIESKARVNCNTTIDSPLMVALKHKNYKLSKLLLLCKASPYSLGFNERQKEEAVSQYRTEMVTYYDPITVLSYAAENSDLRAIKLLVDFKADPLKANHKVPFPQESSKSYWGWLEESKTPFDCLVSIGNIEGIKIIIDNAVRIDNYTQKLRDTLPKRYNYLISISEETDHLKKGVFFLLLVGHCKFKNKALSSLFKNKLYVSIF